MSSKDLVFLVFAASLSAMGFLIANLANGEWLKAALCGFVLLLSIVYVVAWIATAAMPRPAQARRR